MLVKTEYTFSREELVEHARNIAFNMHPDGQSTCSPDDVFEKDDGSVVVILKTGRNLNQS